MIYVYTAKNFVSNLMMNVDGKMTDEEFRAYVRGMLFKTERIPFDEISSQSLRDKVREFYPDEFEPKKAEKEFYCEKHSESDCTFQCERCEFKKEWYSNPPR